MQKLNPQQKGKSKVVGVCLSDEQLKFIKQQGKISDVIRSLIAKEIQKNNKAG